MQKEKFGTTKDGREVTRYTLTNQNGMKVSFIDLGAVITNIWVPDRDGNFDDVVPLPHLFKPAGNQIWGDFHIIYKFYITFSFPLPQRCFNSA